MPKFLFLDIDGVLNTPAAELGFKYALGLDWEKRFKNGDDVLRSCSTAWCPSSLYNLYRIVEKTGCKIVISSTWRHGSSLDEMKAWFQVPLLRDAVIGKTPSILVKYEGQHARIPRGSEIDFWIEKYLDESKTKRTDIKVAILDDDSDMWPQTRNFFQTNGYDGIVWDTATKIIEHLNKEEE